jgi:hypothetical protein
LSQGSRRDLVECKEKEYPSFFVHSISIMMHQSTVLLSLLLASLSLVTTQALVPSDPGSSSSRRAFFRNVAVSTVAASSPYFVANSASAVETEVSAPVPGKRAPPFELPNSRGEGSTSLRQLTKTGKWTVLYFYPGAFSRGCTLEARGFQKDMEKYRDLNAQIVGVSVDPVEKNAQFCSAEGKKILDWLFLQLLLIHTDLTLGLAFSRSRFLHAFRYGRHGEQNVRQCSFHPRLWYIFESSNVYH